MNILIISGGDINYDFALDFITKIKIDTIIAVDAGLEFVYRNQLQVQCIVGDFDSVQEKVINYYRRQGDIEIDAHQPEKDATDTQIAVEKAIDMGGRNIWILGATGRRLDHFLGNVNCLALAQKAGVCAYIVDEYNCMRMIESGTILQKKEQFGKYVSFLPFGGIVTGVNLEGFKYPLVDHTLICEDGIGISNEIAEEYARITFSSGRVLMVQSRD